MRIACPNCQATYEVPDALIGTGRRLRCARCGHDWLVTGGPAPPDAGTQDAGPSDAGPSDAGPEVRRPTPPPPDEIRAHEPAPSDLPPPTPAPRRPPQVISPPLPQTRQTRSSRGAVTLWAAWIGSGLILGALGAAAWVYRGPIIEAWPPAARVYWLVGAADNG